MLTNLIVMLVNDFNAADTIFSKIIFVMKLINGQNKLNKSFYDEHLDVPLKKLLSDKETLLKNISERII